jgi:hypothetical protein
MHVAQWCELHGMPSTVEKPLLGGAVIPGDGPLPVQDPPSNPEIAPEQSAAAGAATASAPNTIAATHPPSRTPRLFIITDANLRRRPWCHCLLYAFRYSESEHIGDRAGTTWVSTITTHCVAGFDAVIIGAGFSGLYGRSRP